MALTLAKALKAEGYLLLNHWNDQRLGYRRHKIQIVRQDHNPTTEQDLALVQYFMLKSLGTILGSYKPYPGSLCFIWKVDGKENPPLLNIGTDEMSVLRRRKYRRKELRLKKLEDWVNG